MQIDYSKGLMVAAIFLLLFLQYRLWLEPGGLIDMMRLKKQYAQQMLENDKLKLRNQKLAQQIASLQKNPQAIEARARTELGMVK